MSLLLEIYFEDVGEQYVRKAGSEYQGPCPSCGGNDRFIVYPGQGSGKAEGMGSFHCGHGKGGNGCGLGGDAIKYLQEFRGMTFKAACDFLGITIDSYTPQNYRPITQPKKKDKDFIPANLDYPAEVENPQLWREKGMKFVEKCHEALLNHPLATAYLMKRGVSQEAIVKYKLGYHEGEERNGKKFEPSFRSRESWGLSTIIKKDTKKPLRLARPAGIVIPYMPDGILHRITIRLSRPKKGRTYHYMVGSIRDVWLTNPGTRFFAVIEAELDCIAVDTAAGDIIGTVGLGSSGVRPDSRAYEVLKNSIRILDALDYDVPGAKGGKFWRENFPRQYKRWPVPDGKDPGEAAENGINLQNWIFAGLPASVVGGEQLNDPVASEQSGSKDTAGCESEFVFLRRLMRESGAIIRIYDNRHGLGFDVPEEYREQNSDKAKKMRNIVTDTGPVGMFIGSLPDGVYDYKAIPVN